MKTRSFLFAVAFGLALPVLAQAAPSDALNPVAGNSVTVNLVQLTHTAPTTSTPRSWFAGPQRVSTAHMGFYFGQANNPPRSVVGWNFHRDLAAQLRYGIYLINRF